MLLLDGGPLPDDYVVAELANDVPLIELVHVRSNVISLRQVEVDVLLGHSLIHF